MKKLMVMLGAAAMAFGLFADDPALYSISFEAAESTKGVSGTTFTPDGIDWVWGGAPLTLKAYDGEVLPYTTGAMARRSDKFDDEANLNYLPLETGSEELQRAVKGNTYLDQLVKFTGFEDVQTNLVDGTKIAVWMSEFPVDGEGDATTTNLFVTCGKFDSEGEVEQVALKIDGDYELDKFYRLTVKSLGNVYADAQTGTCAGFVVYIDGKQIASSDDVAKALIANKDEMTAAAKGLMAAGALFTAIDDTDATFATVAYKGIGAIDDIILDEKGPEFCQAISFTVLPMDGVEVEKVIVKDSDPEEVILYPYAVPANTEVIVYFKAADGYKIGTKTTVEKKIETDGQEIDPADEGIEAAEVVAKKNDTDEFTEAELADALGTLVENDVLAIVKACDVKDEDATLYHFTPNTTITATENGWDIYVGNVEDAVAGSLEINDTIETGFAMKVEFEDDNDGVLTFGGTVDGSLEVVNGTLNPGEEFIEVAGSVKAAAYDFTMFGGFKLAKDAMVLSTDNTIDTDPTTGSIIAADDDCTIEVGDEDDFGYYTYTAVQSAPDTFNVTADEYANTTRKVTVDEEEVFPVEGNVFAIPNGKTAIVTYTAAKHYTVTANGEQTFDKEGTAEEPVLRQWKIYYASLFIGTTDTGVQVGLAPSGADRYYDENVQVPASHSGVVEGSTFDPSNTKKYYVSELVLFGDPNKSCTFTYANDTLAIGTDDIGVQLSGNTISYTVTTGAQANFAKIVLTEIVAAEDDPTVIDPATIPEGKKVSEIFTKVPANLANADAKPFALWCQKEGNKALVGDCGAAAKLDAFLLDCLNDDDAIEAAQANFKVTSITQDANGNWVVTPTTGDSYKNGEVEVKRYSDVGCKTEADNGNFFKLNLTLPGKVK